MKILVACEESQVVCKAFRAKGHEAYSCDIQECSGGKPEWHIRGDVLRVIAHTPQCPGCQSVCLSDHNSFWCDKCDQLWPLSTKADFDVRWDLIIAHPPCTYLCNSGVRWLKHSPERQILMLDGGTFFRDILDSDCPKIAVENPIPHKYAVEVIGRKYDQIIQPWQFGHGETKATCLWLKGLPKLTPTNIVEGREARIHKMPPGPDRAKLRSKTFQGIADAMADQWG